MSDSGPKSDLGDRIRDARAAQTTRSRSNASDKYNQLTLAWRMTIELVVGTTIGFGIGWGLDSLFGVKPLFMLVFGLLGFAAGVKTVMSTAREVGRRAQRAAEGENATGSDQADER
ncbi:MAG: AtpZ/AtpI family protein [Rhodobacteraceae bacterium]|nr:AtpZ/AtpI family protein [Paracoccaceae bacterium]